MPKKRIQGTVISNKSKKTLVIEAERVKAHPKYKKRFKVFKKYKAHTESEKDFKIGDKVKIEECRPLSKEKKWRVVK